MLNSSLFSSAKEDWGTPRWLFRACNAVSSFQLDAAASSENALCPVYYTDETNGLARDWASSTWCNPPYGRTITGQFVRKANSAIAVGKFPRASPQEIRPRGQAGKEAKATRTLLSDPSTEVLNRAW